MRKFEGNINGKVYTDEKEFYKSLSSLERTNNMSVSYKYVDTPDAIEAEDRKTAIECNKNYVSESQYIKNITNKNDVEIDIDLMNKLKCATNKSDIKHNVCRRIDSFNNKISDNLLHINELKSDYNRLEEKLKLINNQIKTLDDANNNYYLNKEYYTKIKNLIDMPVDIPESKEKCESCDCGGECKCQDKDNDEISLKDVYDMSPYELAKYLNKRKIYTLADLVEYFLKKY